MVLLLPSLTGRATFMFRWFRLGARTPSMRKGKVRFWKFAGTLAGIALEAGVGVQPAIECRIVERDVVGVTVEEDVAGPFQQLAGLPLERAADLPVAERSRRQSRLH